jgi:hypothetical protein
MSEFLNNLETRKVEIKDIFSDVGLTIKENDEVKLVMNSEKRIVAVIMPVNEILANLFNYFQRNYEKLENSSVTLPTIITDFTDLGLQTAQNQVLNKLLQEQGLVAVEYRGEVDFLYPQMESRPSNQPNENVTIENAEKLVEAWLEFFLKQLPEFEKEINAEIADKIKNVPNLIEQLLKPYFWFKSRKEKIEALRQEIKDDSELARVCSILNPYELQRLTSFEVLKKSSLNLFRNSGFGTNFLQARDVVLADEKYSFANFKKFGDYYPQLSLLVRAIFDQAKILCGGENSAEQIIDFINHSKEKIKTGLSENGFDDYTEITFYFVLVGCLTDSALDYAEKPAELEYTKKWLKVLQEFIPDWM